MMESANWKNWLSQQDRGECYFLVNSLAEPNPVQLFYLNGWTEQAFPLYSGTPMNAMLEQSPWLIQPKVKCLPELALLLDKHAFSDASWGWGYRSTLPWSFQLEHWRLHQQVLLRGQVVVLRLMDNRIFTPLLPALKSGDWRELLTPVNELMIDTPNPVYYYRPENCPQELNTSLFVLGDHLIEARYSTDTTLKNLAYVLSCQLWEENPELALKLDEPAGQLQHSLVVWLKQARDEKQLLLNTLLQIANRLRLTKIAKVSQQLSI